MLSAVILMASLLTQTSDWREAKLAVPRHWTTADQEKFEETAHGDPVHILRQHHGITKGGANRGLFVPQHSWSHLYPAPPRSRYYRRYSR